MKRSPVMKRLLLFLSAILLLTLSCTEEETCRENMTVALQVSFMNDSTLKATTIDSLSVWGLGKDSLLYNNKKNLGKISLPLNKFEESSIFVLRMNEQLDTMMVLYTNQDYFISFACGSVITHQIDTVLTTNNYISRMLIKQHYINTANVPHLEIYH